MSGSKCKYYVKYFLIAIAALTFLYCGSSAASAVAGIPIARIPLDNNSVYPDYNFEEVSFPARYDSITLKGWYVTSYSSAAVIIVLGGFQNRIDMNVNSPELARDLAEAGYNVLLFDLRGRGESEGKGILLSNIEEDLGGAFDFVVSRGIEPEKIYFLGFSTGAASSAVFAAQHEISAVILCSCFAELKSVAVNKLDSTGIPTSIINILYPGFEIAGSLIYDFTPLNPIEIIDEVECPILFIYEKNDDIVDFDGFTRLAEKADNPHNQLWIVEDARHSQSYKVHPQIFIERVTNFLNIVENKGN
jgi:uncharacterized protein